MKTLLSTGAAKANDLYTVTTTSISEGELVSRVASAVLDTLQEGDYNLCAPCILCGCGNNGADGMALAVLLKEKGIDVQVVYTGKLYEPAPEPKKRKKNQPAPEPMDPEKIGTPELEAMSEQCRERYAQLLTAKIPVLTELPEQATLYVDAVYGISFHGTLNAKIAGVTVEATVATGNIINALKADASRQRPFANLPHALAKSYLL
jgi:NAD(P)H-hydrate repair Nnr-like enzyme with NAD(P)H-hydrate epimerase domain